MKQNFKWNHKNLAAFGLIIGTISALISVSLGVSIPSGLWPHAFFLLGTSIFFDSVHYLTTGQSLFSRIWRKKSFFLVPFTAGFVVEAMLDLVGIYLFATWSYPMFERLHYLPLYIILAPLGLLFLYESYTALTALLRKGFGTKASFDLPIKEKRNWARLVGLIGLALLLSSFLIFWSVPLNPWYIQFFVGFGFVGILEYLGWRRGEETLLTHILRRDPIPLVSIFFLSFTLAWGWEAMNARMGSWLYLNLPKDAIILTGGVPLLALLQWPFLYILFISFYRAVFASRKEPCPW